MVNRFASYLTIPERPVHPSFYFRCQLIYGGIVVSSTSPYVDEVNHPGDPDQFFSWQPIPGSQPIQEGLGDTKAFLLAAGMENPGSRGGHNTHGE